MKKMIIAVVVILIAVLMLGAVKLPLPVAGTYDVKPVTIKSKEIFTKKRITNWKVAQIVDSKPTDLKVNPEIEKITEIKYASIRLGNSEKETWLAFSKNNYEYYTEIYIDQDLNGEIDLREKIKAIDTFQVDDDGYTINVSRSYPEPVPLYVAYKGSTGEIRKKLNYYIQIDSYLKKKTGETLFVVFNNATALEGQIQVTEQNTVTYYQFRLFDRNGNGCYNDFGTDYIVMDMNVDRKFDIDEGQLLNEYFALKENGKKKSMRFVVLPYPAKVKVIDATAEFDQAQLEPESDSINPDESNPI